MSGTSLRRRPPRGGLTPPERNPVSGVYQGDPHSRKERHDDSSPRRRPRLRQPQLVAAAAGVAVLTAVGVGAVIASQDGGRSQGDAAADSVASAAPSDSTIDTPVDGVTVDAIWSNGIEMGTFTLVGPCDGVGDCTVIRPATIGEVYEKLWTLNDAMQTMPTELQLTAGGYYEATGDFVEYPVDGEGCTPAPRTYSLRVVVTATSLDGTISAPDVECGDGGGGSSRWVGTNESFTATRG